MITVSTKQFTEALKKCQKVVAKKPTLAILSGIKAESNDNVLSLYATDLANFICLDIPCVSDNNTSFVFDDIKSLIKSVSLFGDSISFDIISDGSNISVTSDNKKLILPSFPIEEFPVWPVVSQLTDVKTYNLNGTDFDTIYQKLKHSISDEDARPVLNGIFVKPNYFGTTNGFVASTIGNNLLTDSDFNIHTLSADLFKMINTGILTVGNNGGGSSPFYFFENEDTHLCGWLVSGNMPDIPQITPQFAEEHTEFTVNRKSLLDNLKYLISMKPKDAGKNDTLKVKFEGNNIYASAVNSYMKVDDEIVYAEVKTDDSFGDVPFAVNSKLLYDALNGQFTENMVTIDFWSAKRPIMFRDIESNGSCLVMPMFIG